MSIKSEMLKKLFPEGGAILPFASQNVPSDWFDKCQGKPNQVGRTVFSMKKAESFLAEWAGAIRARFANGERARVNHSAVHESHWDTRRTERAWRITKDRIRYETEFGCR